MNNQPFTGAHFAAFCLSMVGQPYWYGTCLYKCSESLRARKARQYPSHYSSSRTARYQRDTAREKICADCIGGAKGYAWTNGGQGVVDSIGIPGSPKSKYASNNCPDKSANGMFKYAKSQNRPWGAIGTLPETPGLALHKDGHVGFYVGNGYAVEWRGFNYGCVRTKVADRGWKYWYQLPFIQYESAPALKPSLLGTRLLRRGMRGDDVKELQTLLLRLGYALPKYGADGDFGSETRSALRQFQKAARIEVDGVYGENSHAALMRAISDLQGDSANEAQPHSSPQSDHRSNGTRGLIAPQDDNLADTPSIIAQSDSTAESRMPAAPQGDSAAESRMPAAPQGDSAAESLMPTAPQGDSAAEPQMPAAPQGDNSAESPLQIAQGDASDKTPSPIARDEIVNFSSELTMASDTAVPICISEIEPLSDEEVAPPAPLPRLTVVSEQSAAIRIGNAPDFALLTFAPPGSSFDCIATAPNGWHAIPVGGQIGWISDSASRIDLPPRIDS